MSPASEGFGSVFGPLVVTNALADERPMPPVMTEVVKHALAADRPSGLVKFGACGTWSWHADEWSRNTCWRSVDGKGVVRWMKLATSNFEVVPLDADAASIPATVSSHEDSVAVSSREDYSVAASWLKPEGPGRGVCGG
eukprot:s3507_g6.t1